MTQGLAALLTEKRDEILDRFVREVQKTNTAPTGTSAPKIVDHIPRFLDAIARELATRSGKAMSEQSAPAEPARKHGEQRWSLGYDLHALIREYDILRQCILAIARETETALSIDEFDALAFFLNLGITEAAAEYAEFRDGQVNRERRNLEFISEAGVLLSSSLDYRSTLNRLTSLLVPRLADWCSIYMSDIAVDDMPLAHVNPDKLEVLRSLYRGHPLPDDLPRGHLHVMKTGEPEFVPVVDDAMLQQIARSAAHLELLRRLAMKSWMILPLRVHGHSVGALTLAYSESNRSYEAADLLVGKELASRAAAAIDNARLYELSQQARSRAETATRAKDEFVAAISHELRTPISVVLGWAKLLRDGGLPDDRRERAFEVIERNAQAQSKLVSDLLDISRVITGKVRVNPTQVDLSNVVDMALEGARFAADAKGITLDVKLDRANSVVRADGDRLQQVVGNIVSNAVKFTPKHGRVEVVLARVGSDIEIVVTDNGQGISPEFLPQIFESFRQEDGGTSRGHGGLGIGLSIAKHLVELHGGSISAHSEGVGRGARFVVRIPVSPLISGTFGVSRMPAAAVAASPPSAIAAHSLRGLRVLVVDDERDARDIIAIVLEKQEVVVRQAASAEEAMELLESFSPHVIVSDIGMPHEDGYSLIRRIRTHAAEEKKNTPAIALTAFAQNEDRARALVEGFNAHLTKPVEPQELVRVLAELSAHLRP